MPDLGTCKFDKDPTKNERAGMETSFFHYTMIFFFQCSKARNTEVNNPIQLEFELI